MRRYHCVGLTRTSPHGTARGHGRETGPVRARSVRPGDWVFTSAAWLTDTHQFGQHLAQRIPCSRASPGHAATPSRPRPENGSGAMPTAPRALSTRPHTRTGTSGEDCLPCRRGSWRTRTCERRAASQQATSRGVDARLQRGTHESQKGILTTPPGTAPNCCLASDRAWWASGHIRACQAPTYAGTTTRRRSLGAQT